MESHAITNGGTSPDSQLCQLPLHAVTRCGVSTNWGLILGRYLRGILLFWVHIPGAPNSLKKAKMYLRPQAGIMYILGAIGYYFGSILGAPDF